MRRAAGRALVAAVLAATACAPDPPAAVVAVRAEGCGTHNGSGAFVAEGVVLTAAHTVAGANAISVVHDGAAQAAELVAFDPGLDLAVLRTDGPHGLPFRPSTTVVDPGTPATVWAVRHGAVVAVPVTIVRRVTIDTTDIYLEGEYQRPGFELTGTIEPGDSGAPVIAGGALVGVVWARSTEAAGRAWAIAPVPISGLADATRCTR